MFRLNLNWWIMEAERKDHIFFNHELDIPTTAIEVNQAAFSHLQQNLRTYQEKFPKKSRENFNTRTKSRKISCKRGR